MVNDTKQEQVDKLILELRRGVIVLAVLSQCQQEHYGYSLRQELADRGFDVNEGTLYPLLRRLESQGLLDSRWEISENRPRRYYVISKLGKEILDLLKDEWANLGSVMKNVMSNGSGGK